MDSWTDANSEQYIAVTGHHVGFTGDHPLTMNSGCLSVSPVGARELSDNISDHIHRKLEAVFDRAKLDIFVFAVTIDNGANFKAAAKGIFDMRRVMLCMAHTLNLVVTDAIGLDNFRSSLDLLRRIITYIDQQNGDAKRMYVTYCKEHHGKKLALTKDCVTR